ncbi:spindle and kinetochore-associated protein 1 [Gymnodraco acuticeps]|uniref:SKA complex subunit 1 n=1 Tax=Gymnodraco acuticeps TaxID=8218 RepID=A0A6P8SZ50_GYMAC|nr:spindle and kinetochore-associated protein 1 [Gymnodraco acuticeps]
MCDLLDVSLHIHDRISSLRSMLALAAVELPQNKIKKLGQELSVVGGLLEQFEKCVGQQREELRHLKGLEESFKENVGGVQHMKDNVPAHMPKKRGPANGGEAALKQDEAVQPAQQHPVRKSNKSCIRSMDVITVPEFESIPQYMRGRVSYDQMNAAVQSINTAVTAKYKILHQSMKTLNNYTRKLHQRFKEQETKDTKGQNFVVQEDIQEFSKIKVDKRFQGILNMLRHCQRLREMRGGGLTRYMLL